MKKVENPTFKTADGQTFKTQNYAQLHANSLSNKSVVPVNADDSKEPALLLLDKADEIISFANDTEDADALVIYLENENGRKKPRTTVVDAIEARLNELNAD